MAAITKYTNTAIDNHIKHNTRGFATKSNPQNPNIYHEMTYKNYSFSIQENNSTSRVISARESKSYYKQRMAEVYHMNRANLITACEWCCTLPKELLNAPEDLQRAFFQETFNFLNHKYGKENCVQAIVHFDEGIRDENGNRVLGAPHLHYIFIPVVKVTDANPTHAQSKYPYKVNAKELISKRHLHKFHSEYQAWMEQSGIPCRVSTGITNGKNKTVETLKEETRQLQMKQKMAELENENNRLKEKITILEQEIEVLQRKSTDRSIEWGETDSSWGSDPW